MNKIKITFMLFCAMLLCTAAFAQSEEETEEELRTEFTGEELKNFILAYKKAAEIQKEEQEVMVATIEKHDLKVDRFNEILVAQQEGQLSEAKLSGEEREDFKAAVIEVIKLQKNAREKAGDAIEEFIDLETYQQISIAYKEDADFKKKLDNLLKNAPK
ncbi:DUF4168 domain-containing protein [Cytophagaceae bacterium ABcell3]|nr:DUF4168 domain-containing protein [Cytophagaceae bacterium ABcell3]